MIALGRRYTARFASGAIEPRPYGQGPVPAQQGTPLSGCAFDQLRLIYRASFVPVPPLHIQEEIVTILDRFEALVSDLKDGLPAEITARHKQYEHYRNQLLTFKPLT